MGPSNRNFPKTTENTSAVALRNHCVPEKSPGDAVDPNTHAQVVNESGGSPGCLKAINPQKGRMMEDYLPQTWQDKRKKKILTS